MVISGACESARSWVTSGILSRRAVAAIQASAAPRAASPDGFSAKSDVDRNQFFGIGNNAEAIHRPLEATPVPTLRLEPDKQLGECLECDCGRAALEMAFVSVRERPVIRIFREHE